MAVGLITSCSTLTTYNVDYSGTLLPGTIYYLTFVGATPAECYTFLGSGSGPTDTVATISAPYVDCATCQSEPTLTPTVTPTPTPTVTPTNNQWKTALILNLQQLVDYGYFFYVNGNEVTIYNLTCASSSEPITLQINVGVNIDISCQ